MGFWDFKMKIEVDGDVSSGGMEDNIWVCKQHSIVSFAKIKQVVEKECCFIS
jgi:hypothetical protein